MFSGWTNNYHRVFWSACYVLIHPPRCDSPLKSVRIMKPTEPMWAVKYKRVCVWATRGNRRVRESVNPLDGCTRPFGFAEADANSWPQLHGSRFSERCRRGRAETVSIAGRETRALVMCSFAVSYACCQICVFFLMCEPVCVWCRLRRGR